jgi:glucosylceramidase
VYLTTKDMGKRLARQPQLGFRPGSGMGANNVTVDPATTYQPLSAGFGVAMTDSSAFVLDRRLSPAVRDHVMQLLFSPRNGIGLSFMRVPIGGSDYIVDARAPSRRA